MEKRLTEAEMLEKMKQTQLEIYKDFEALCKELELPFFVEAGALIGAVRHGGFIPWDDDIDVGMLRDDYNKLREYLLEHPSEKYEILSPETQEGYVLPLSKFTKKGTCYIEAAHSYRNYKEGIAMDIFPFDATSTDEKERMAHKRDIWIWNRILVLSEYATPVLPDGLNPLVHAVCKLGCKLVHYFFKLIGFTREKAYRKFYKCVTKYAGKENVLYSCFDDIPYDIHLEKEDIFPMQELPFGDTTIVVMNNYHKHLTQAFRNYMELPPEDKRHNHPPKYADFGDGCIYESRA